MSELTPTLARELADVMTNAHKLWTASAWQKSWPEHVANALRAHAQRAEEKETDYPCPPCGMASTTFPHTCKPAPQAEAEPTCEQWDQVARLYVDGNVAAAAKRLASGDDVIVPNLSGGRACADAGHFGIEYVSGLERDLQAAKEENARLRWFVKDARGHVAMVAEHHAPVPGPPSPGSECLSGIHAAARDFLARTKGLVE